MRRVFGVFGSRRLYELAGVLLVTAYMVFAIFVVAVQLYPAEFSKRPSGKALAANTVRFEEHSGAPSPNDIFNRVNHVRAEKGLQPMRSNAVLADAARDRAQDMARRNYYAHKNPDGLYYYDYLRGSGFGDNSYSCENLDLQFTLLPEKYVDDWLNSRAGHRECLLNESTTEAGYAVVSTDRLADGQTAYIVVAIHSQAQ